MTAIALSFIVSIALLLCAIALVVSDFLALPTLFYTVALGSAVATVLLSGFVIFRAYQMNS
ncbi:hypothetical protein NIES2135_21420 [Leptolyngbya boryana NIES-2135]|jgi:uncharacterized membrane protein|uniref:Uncharacterized protein n=1 Tax=Leptolyngbya boryana NIES-2135 TaxID=1973484 RepID=A0A1Z4JEY2_LEPBY|nr:MULTISPECIES: hypothetical protein [Leptolyngbya]BAY55319.1 hypothetical protein NIES2135_21420 [Leptolyngbya boryana NIES-2135]MBD2369401.1 hypothetical protein [Leptolyngbya sp. FACHB-161]MBD2375597.1 hypothetical protein [Leptolyngbya sp. FACHB-238]MBD2401730.1 hypothetical protein [Leptolyngbya sp. FACHB-239]MBD2406531.1 hypothetical protein [Leptolyngbya sp. FACHB-402]